MAIWRDHLTSTTNYMKNGGLKGKPRKYIKIQK